MFTPGIDRLVPIGEMSWTALPGFEGLQVLTLSSNFDEAARSGRRTRLVRFAPGAKTTETLVHDYHEEAFLLSGDLEGFGEAVGFGHVKEHAYVHRQPGTRHGPVRSSGGCTLLEVHYYEDRPSAHRQSL